MRELPISIFFLNKTEKIKKTLKVKRGKKAHKILKVSYRHIHKECKTYCSLFILSPCLNDGR